MAISKIPIGENPGRKEFQMSLVDPKFLVLLSHFILAEYAVVAIIIIVMLISTITKKIIRMPIHNSKLSSIMTTNLASRSTSANKLNINIDIKATNRIKTDAIGVLQKSKQFYTKDVLYKASIHFNSQNILINRKIDSNSASSHNTALLEQELQNALVIINYAVDHQLSSIELIYSSPEIYGYVTNIQKSNLMAFQYAQEINELSKQIDIIFTNIKQIPLAEIVAFNEKLIQKEAST